MKFKLFIAVFFFLFAILAIGFFTEKTADDDEHTSDYNDVDNEESAVEEGVEEEEKPVPTEEKSAPAEEKSDVQSNEKVDETTDVDSVEISDKQLSDSDVISSVAVDADSETVDNDVKKEVACVFEDTRYLPCDHVQGKIQKQLCSASKVWEDENECFAKPVTTEMISLSSGSFWMGSPTNESGRNQDESRHFVQLSVSYSVGKYEVTQGLFHAVLGYNPSHFQKCGNKCPVEMVSWHEALKYANELSKIERVSNSQINLFIGDSVSGNDLIDQIELFDKVVGIDGMILTKTDTDERPGSIVTAAYAIDKPIYYLGIGQGYDDLIKFDAKLVAEKLFEVDD
jgi:hypothetical protein